MAPEALAPGVADVSHLESLEMKCKLFYELFCTTEDPRFLQAIKDAVIDACPTLRFGPHAKDEGEAAFLAFDVKTPLNDERIANLIEIVKPLVPDAIQLEPDLIRAVHEVMCSEKIDEQTLGQLFPHSALVFFLEFCHVNIELPYEKDSLVEGVRHAFRASQIHARHSIGSTLPSTPLNNDKQAEDGVFLSYKRCLATIVKYIEHVQQQGRKLAQESALAADGILKYRSMEDLKRRFYEVNDVHEMELLVSQIHKLHVAETATRLNALLRLFDEMVKVINECLQGK